MLHPVLNIYILFYYPPIGSALISNPDWYEGKWVIKTFDPYGAVIKPRWWW